MHVIHSEAENLSTKYSFKASDLMQGQSHQVNAVLEQWDARNKTFTAFTDSPGNPLSRLPLESFPLSCLLFVSR